MIKTRPLLYAALVVPAVALAFVLTAVLGYQTVLRQFSRPSLRVDASRAEVIRQMRDLNRFETASYSIDKVVEAGTDGNAFQQFFFGDRILLMAQGEVTAGFDLSRLDDKDISVRGNTVVVRLPKPELLNVRLDNGATRVYDRRLGLLSRGDKDLESRARVAAEQSIREAAAEADLLERAAANGAALECSGRDHLGSLAMLEACIRSSREQCGVAVADLLPHPIGS